MLEDIQLNQARAVFADEARELLAELEASLLALGASADGEAVGAAFRAAHTIKGAAGMFGLTAVVSFTHAAEALLERLRAGELPVSERVVALLLECRDQIEVLLDDALQGGGAAGADLEGKSARLLALLSQVGAPPAPPGASAPTAPAAVVAVAPPLPEAWLLHIRFGRDTFVDGFDPLSFLRYLPTLGEVIAAELIADDVPALDLLEPERCHLAVALRLVSMADKREIESVFDFLTDSIELQIIPPPLKTAQMRELLAEYGDERTRLGDLLVRIGALTQRELALVLQEQAAEAGCAQATPTPLGERVVQRQLAPPDLVQAALGRQGQLRDRRSDEARFVRVQADKLDALIALVGELVTAGSATQILAARHADTELAEAAARVRQLVEGARDRALELRMVPIGATFARFKRIAHEIGQTLGKQVELEISGGDAELDKSMIDQIVDPLTHLVRNALDHGLETPAERMAAGKPACGSLALRARHESGSIVIEVADDGRGLPRERILAKAIERGLVAADSELSDDEVYALVFQPGLSTASQVTDLSGRGVGMDVVRRNIEALRGEVRLTSRAGAGSVVQIRLPLTLAIIDGFRFEVADQSFVVPLDNVVECIEAPPLRRSRSVQECNRYGVGNECGVGIEGDDHCFTLRGEVLPLLCLRDQLGLSGPRPAQDSVLVMRLAGAKVGVLVDRLLGEHQTVVKPLGRTFRKLRGFSGSTILGTGCVALILDIPALVARATQARSGLVRPPAPATSLGRPPAHPSAAPALPAAIPVS